MYLCVKCGEEIDTPFDVHIFGGAIIPMHVKCKGKGFFCHRTDGRIGWSCEHGVMHTVHANEKKHYKHDCDGCCRRGREELMKKALKEGEKVKK